ncbi:MAG: hypothetical protein HKN76_11145 [Saprospiraceae bacterium]|nr:hypothetical protein [Saprospiraceae bacterium]
MKARRRFLRNAALVVAVLPFPHLWAGAKDEFSESISDAVKHHLALFRKEMLGDSQDTFFKDLVFEYTRPTRILDFRSDENGYRFSFENNHRVTVELSKVGVVLESRILG